MVFNRSVFAGGVLRDSFVEVLLECKRDLPHIFRDIAGESLWGNAVCLGGRHSTYSLRVPEPAQNLPMQTEAQLAHRSSASGWSRFFFLCSLFFLREDSLNLFSQSNCTSPCIPVGALLHREPAGKGFAEGHSVAEPSLQLIEL